MFVDHSIFTNTLFPLFMVYVHVPFSHPCFHIVYSMHTRLSTMFLCYCRSHVYVLFGHQQPPHWQYSIENLYLWKISYFFAPQEPCEITSLCKSLNFYWPCLYATHGHENIKLWLTWSLSISMKVEGSTYWCRVFVYWKKLKFFPQ